jgi:hypothetical protein
MMAAYFKVAYLQSGRRRTLIEYWAILGLAISATSGLVASINFSVEILDKERLAPAL